MAYVAYARAQQIGFLAIPAKKPAENVGIGVLRLRIIMRMRFFFVFYLLNENLRLINHEIAFNKP